MHVTYSLLEKRNELKREKVRQMCNTWGSVTKLERRFWDCAVHVLAHT